MALPRSVSTAIFSYLIICIHFNIANIDFINVSDQIIVGFATTVHTLSNMPGGLDGDPVTKKYTPVKLTSKQGFILNQLLGTYALDSPADELCKKHVNELKLAVRAFEPWALKMIDSSSKLQAGLLLGNLAEFGSFDQCLRIKTDSDFGPILGKYCLIKISPSENLISKVLRLSNLEKKEKNVEREMFIVDWSVCVPHSSPIEDILHHFNKTIKEITVGVDLEVTLDDNNCQSALDLPVMGRIQYAVLSFYAMFIIMGIIASFIDIKMEKDKTETTTFVKIFSTYRHCYSVCEVSSFGKYDFLYGLKTLSSFIIVMGHRFIMYLLYQVINGLDELEWTANYSSLLILGSTVCVDSFFMVSGMFVSMGFFQHVTKTGKFNIAAFYIYRYLRITLPLFLVWLFYVSLVHFLANGPYSYDVYVMNQKPCQDFWWSTLLHLQTIVNPGHLCIFQAWYLSCEMPFYFFSPMLLYPLWKWPKLGYVCMVGGYVIFMTISFYLAWINKYNGIPLPVTNQILFRDFFVYYYVAPHVRAPPYLLGLAFGYFLYTTKEKIVTLNITTSIFGWITSLVLLLVTAGGCYPFYMDDHKYNVLESASYLAFARSGWTVGLMWIIWCCINGYGGILQEFLSAYIFKILGRITYGIFLIHTIIQVYKGGSIKTPMTFTNFNAVYDGLADIFMSIIISFLFTVFFEMPLVRIQVQIFKVKTKTKNTVEVKPISTI